MLVLWYRTYISTHRGHKVQRISMRSKLSLVLALLVCWLGSPAMTSTAQALRYPDTRRGGTVDNYHGTHVPDPYRWLETLDSEETEAWIVAQNALAEPYLDALPERAHFLHRLQTLQEAVPPGVLQKQGPYWVTQTRRPDGSRVFYVQDDLAAPKRLLLDPAALFPDEDVTINNVRISPHGRYVLYTVSPGGTRLMEARVRDLEREHDLPDRIPGLKFNGPYWTADSRGFVYYRYLQIGEDGVDRESTVFYHELGTTVTEDRVLARSDPADVGATTWSRVSHDGRFVWVYDDFGDRQQVSVLDLGDPLSPRFGGPLVPLNEARDGTTEVIGHVGRTLYLHTSRGAPNYQVVAVDLDAPMRWRTVLPEAEHLLQHARVIGERIVAAYRRDVKSVLEIYDLDGTHQREVKLPTSGSVFYLNGDPDGPMLTFAFDAYAHPYTLFRHDLRTGETVQLGARGTGHDPDDFVTRQVFFDSEDGTRVPMFVVHRTDLSQDGTTPTLLYGYGAGGGVEEPMFRDDWFAWIEAGGILAVANVRGGGEYGMAWRQAGERGQKQNTYDDFIAAAETLIREGYTSPERLAINGASNGGLLVGAVMTQRPDLFAAVLPVVGVLDALRFPSFTAGPRWATSHGDPSDPEAFDWLYAWSPLHRIEDRTCYPATLVTTAANDDLVHPSQSYKFAARLQAAQGCDHPALLRVYPTGGHAVWSDLETQADVLAFAAHHTGLAVPTR